jgi:hypothetical protein
VALGFSKADAGHGLAEELAVLGHFDGLALGPDQLDAVLVEHAHVRERERRVERRLAAHGGQERVGAFLGDDLGDDLRRDGLDVGGVRELRVGHDGRGVGVDQDDAVALLAQRLAGLGAGIVELAACPITMGPAPMIRIERMSVLLGMEGLRARCPGAETGVGALGLPEGGKLAWL